MLDPSNNRKNLSNSDDSTRRMPLTHDEDTQTQSSPSSFFMKPAAPEPTKHQGKLPTHLGRYQIKGFLGEGGFGCVYDAFDPRLERQVAIKVPHEIESDEAIAEFLAEGPRLASLNHRGILKVHDVGVEGKRRFLVTDYVKGKTLTATLRSRPMSCRESCELVASIADALAHAHSHRIVHRDVKPSNIMLRENGEAVLLDFGLAIRDADVKRPDGRISGTPAYMSPEQAQGEAHRIDGRTDIFSLGVVLYELLTSTRPFKRNSKLETLNAVISSTPASAREINRGIPDSIDAICMKALEKNLDQRYTSAHEFANDLRQAIQAPIEDSTSMSVPSVQEESWKSSLTDDVDFGKLTTVPMVACQFHIDAELDFELKEEMRLQLHNRVLALVEEVDATVIESSGGFLLLGLNNVEATGSATLDRVVDVRSRISSLCSQLATEHQASLTASMLALVEQVLMRPGAGTKSTRLVAGARKSIQLALDKCEPSYLYISNEIYQQLERTDLVDPAGTLNSTTRGQSTQLYRLAD